MIENTELIETGGWRLRVRKPAQGGGRTPILLLHGFTGDENSMWVFAARLPREAAMLAPRGPYATPLGGYGWHEQIGRGWPRLADFEAPLERLRSLLDAPLAAKGGGGAFHLVGFSQGAAMAYAFALTYPQRVVSLAALSGFAPQDALEAVQGSPLLGKSVLITHGSDDELVPLNLAHSAAEVCKKAGAQVTFCEDRVGHKLGASCFRGLEAFYERVWEIT
ncbi:MAG: alpha/beta fold hydrolase [Chloroflexi bacterium]|nr:alpha/beta fold hydrolase [Chloroflexota bacterium]